MPPRQKQSPPVDNDELQPEASYWSLILRMLGLAWQYRGGCIKVLSIQIMIQLTVIAGLALIGLGIDIVRHFADPAIVKAPAFPILIDFASDLPRQQQILAVAASIILVGLLQFLFQRQGTNQAGKLVHQGIVVDLRAKVYDKMQRLSFRFFDSNDSGSIINRVTSDVQAVGTFINGVVLQTIQLLVGMSIALFYMIKLSPFLTMVCMITTPFLLLVSVNYARTVKPAYREARKLVDKLILVLSEYLQGIHVVKGFARQSQEVDKFGMANDDVRDKRDWIFVRTSIFNPLIVFLTQLNLVVLLCVGGWLVNEGKLDVGTGLVVFAGLLTQFSSQVSALANITNTIQAALTSANRVFEILDAPMGIESKPGALAMTEARGKVRFEHVTFGYKAEEPVLENIDFEVQPGQCVAIVGSTGAGKSTLMSLIPRFYDPTQGSVYIDDVNVRDVEVQDVRRQIGLVFQESFLFSNTIAANIAFGHPEATQDQIEKAAKIAAAHNFIMELPEGYDSIIGEKGADLSGGQRQRLAIARAVLLEPAILILDDATAAIDPQTEHEILQAMDNATKGRTTFMVAHRLSTLRKADLVIVLEKGRIVQAGTHEQLMSTRGHYRRAAMLQSADAQSKRLLGLSNTGNRPTV